MKKAANLWSLALQVEIDRITRSYVLTAGDRFSAFTATAGIAPSRLPDALLTKALAKAHRWRAMLEADDENSVAALAAKRTAGSGGRSK